MSATTTRPRRRHHVNTGSGSGGDGVSDDEQERLRITNKQQKRAEEDADNTITRKRPTTTTTTQPPQSTKSSKHDSSTDNHSSSEDGDDDNDPKTSTTKSTKKHKRLADFNIPKTKTEILTLLSKDTTRAAREKKVMEKIDAMPYKDWTTWLSWGFGILLYGFGSKIKVLDQFMETTSLKHTCQVCVIKGFSKTMDFDDVAHQLLVGWIGMTTTRAKQERAGSTLVQRFARIVQTAEEDKNLCELLVIIHSIDAIPLRAREYQECLSVLAACKKVHMIASSNHINVRLLWTTLMLDRFNWLWCKALTYDDYFHETNEYEMDDWLGDGIDDIDGTCASGAVTHILKSLTNNHIAVLKEMCRRQLQDPDSLGIEYKDLLGLCQDHMWASDATLRHYLNEFVDHELVGVKKGPDGIERYVVRLTKSVMEGEVMLYGVVVGNAVS